MLFKKFFLLFSICGNYKDPVKSEPLECSENSKTSDSPYLRRIPRDPITYFQFKFATENEKAINYERSLKKSVVPGYDFTDLYVKKEKEFIENDGGIYASAFCQLLISRSVSVTGKSQLHNIVSPVNVYTFKNRPDTRACAYFHTIWFKESSLKRTSLSENCFTALHELHHIIHGDYRSNKSMYNHFNDRFSTEESYSKYIEYSADVGALEYMGSAAAINEVAEKCPDDYNSSNGYLNKKQYMEFAKEARKQEDQFKANFSYNDMILQQKEFTQDDLNQFKFNNTTKKELLQDQEEHAAYMKNLSSDNDNNNEFQAVNDRKMTMLLAIQKKLHIEIQLFDIDEENNDLKNKLYIKLLHIHSMLEESGYINQKVYSDEFYYNGPSYIDKENNDLKNKLYIKLLHVNSMLEEHAYINARVHSDQFQYQYPSDVNAEELKKRSFNDLKGNQDKSERWLLSNLFAALQYNNLDKLEVDLNWVDLEITKANLERNQEEVERLKCIKANYEEQIESLKGS